MTRRIYLDNAATSWPKPESVYQAVDHFQRHVGTAAGRGGYQQAIDVDRTLQQTRHQLAQLIHARSADQIAFAYSGTDALMLAIQGAIRPGDHIVTTAVEHNSVLRPLKFLQTQRDIGVTRVGCDADGYVNPSDIAKSIRSSTRLVVTTHASNVTGAVQPIAEIAAICSRHETLFLVDAAQSLGHIPLSVEDLNCDLLAAPAHKGLMAPTGTGLLYIRPGLEDQIVPVRMGGTGTSSESDEPPTACPIKFESGNLNVPGLVGLHAGLAYLDEHGVEAIHQHELALTHHLIRGLQAIEGVTLYGPVDEKQPRLGVVSFNLADEPPYEIATYLEQAGGIQTRAGFHCSPRMHHALQTQSLGGTVRISCGAFNDMGEIDELLEALRSYAA